LPFFTEERGGRGRRDFPFSEAIVEHALKNTHFHNFKELRKFVENWINSKEKSFYHVTESIFCQKNGKKLYKMKENILKFKVFVYYLV